MTSKTALAILLVAFMFICLSTQQGQMPMRFGKKSLELRDIDDTDDEYSRFKEYLKRKYTSRDDDINIQVETLLENGKGQWVD